eukprot:4936950-Alexandrium_andersonii.AAC.1
MCIRDRVEGPAVDPPLLRRATVALAVIDPAGPTTIGRQGLGDVADLGPAGRPTQDHADDRAGL